MKNLLLKALDWSPRQKCLLALLPTDLRRWLAERLFQSSDRSSGQIFTEVYSRRMWGGPTTAEFYSGEGTEEAASQPYVDRIRGLITEHGIKTVLDIGCGDFRVGEKILHGTNIQGYIGVDVVPDLVRYNERRFRAVAGVQFLCLDAVKDELPAADLCLLRLVLQHLSNHQVQILLSKVARYPLVIATDEISDASPGDYNRDKSPGPHVRLGKGLALEHSPFGAKIEKLFEQPLGRKAVMRTVRIITRAVA